VRGKLAFLLSVVCIFGAAAAVSSPAQAAEKTRHCAAKVGTATAKPSAPVCFAGFSEAVSYATGGAVLLPEGATSVTQAQLDRGYATSRAAAVTVIIGISYWNTNYQGSTWITYASAGCDNNKSTREWYYQFNSSWNDKTGSAKAYANCVGQYWEIGHGTWGEGVTVWTNWSGGPMNDQATFVEWK